jgi:hypothetical protein
MIQDYSRARDFYGQSNNYAKQIECLDLLEDW